MQSAMWTTAVFLIVCVGSLWCQESPLVETALGKIRGYYKYSYDGRIFCAFEGIPYAKPPVGELRFEEPVDIEPWSGIWESTTPNECMQIKWFTEQLQGHEDCLYLNVYVPKSHPVPGENLDVVVHIHGGGFMMGHSMMFGPEYLMDRNIIYVNLNYRLGPLGFLSTEDEVVPGNNGLKDQTKALQWIQKHISAFGGNPKSVTITGMSAGGSSVHFHMLSPLSKGLFHRAISQSGTALAPWALQDVPLEMAKKLGLKLGCDITQTKDLVKCLKQRPAKELTKRLDFGSPIYTFPLTPFAPVIERKSTKPFLSKHPYTLLKHGDVNDVPWITSMVTEEGMLGVLTLNNSFDVLNKQWSEALPYVLDYVYTVPDTKKFEVAENIKRHYFNRDDVSRSNVQTYVKMFGDRYFYLSGEKSVRMHAKSLKSPTYVYMYGYKSSIILPYYTLLGIKEYLGVNHGDDALMLYTMTFGNFKWTRPKLSEADERMKTLLLDLFVSFAKDAKPTVQGVEWNSVEHSDHILCLHLTNDGEEMISVREFAPTKFWDSLLIRDVSIKDEL